MACSRQHATRRWALIAVLALCLAATVLAQQHRAHAQTATLTDLSVANVTSRSALATVTVTSPGTVYVRYSLTSTENWNSAGSAVALAGDSSVSVDLNGLTPNAVYDVQASSDEGFPDGPATLSATFKNRAHQRDLTPLDSNQEDPWGIWGNSDTVWVSNDGDGANNKIYAYQRSDGEPDSTKDFTIHEMPENRNPIGIWSDGTTMFVVNDEEEKVFAYQMSDRSHDADKDFDLVSDHDTAKGIWGNADTIWVLENGLGDDNKLLAYKRATGMYGERDPSRDVALHDAGNDDGEGIWSDGATIWVVDNDDKTIYAYDLATRERRPAQDIVFDGDDIWPRGLWGEAGVVWLVSTRPSSEGLYAYYAPPAGPGTTTVTAVSLSSTARDSATASVTVSSAGAVHLRHSPPGLELWTRAPSATATTPGTVELTLPGLLPHADYDIEVSQDTTFNTGVRLYSFTNRPQTLDLAAGHAAPWGVWGNSSTIWVANNQTGTGSKLLAYRRSDGSRLSGQDFEIHTAGSEDALGIWSDGSTMFVVDQEDGKVYAFRMSNRSHDMSKDFDLASNHEAPRGIWGNATTMWVGNDGDGDDNRVMAYSRAAATYGERDSSKDFALNSAGNGDSTGIGSDGVVMWVADTNDEKIYAYDLTTRSRLPVHDVALDDGGGEPTGLWSEGDILWVVNDGAAVDQIVGYYLPVSGTFLSGIAFSDVTATGATATVRIARGGGTGRTVHLRYRLLGADWTTTSVDMSTVTARFMLTNLVAGARVTVHSSLDGTFPSNATVAREFTPRPVASDFSLAANNDSVRGIWSDGTLLWAVNDEGPGAGRVYAYDLATGTRNTAKSFALVGGNSDPRGVFANSETMWVTDRDDSIYAYTITAGNTYGDPDTARGFERDSGGRPTGIWGNTDTRWVVEHVSEEVYAYAVTPSGTFGDRVPAREFELPFSYSTPLGAWSDGSTMWVADGTRDRLAAYRISSDGLGRRELGRDIRLVDGNDHPSGIWSDGSTMWVADRTDDKLYAYSLPAAASGAVTGVAIDSVTRGEATVTVYIANPGSLTKTVRLVYGQDHAATPLESRMDTTGTELSFALTGLSEDAEYSMSVVLDGVVFPTGGFKTQSRTDEMREALRTQLVETYEGRYPWLRETYNEMRRRSVQTRAGDMGGYSSVSYFIILNPGDALYTTGIDLYAIDTISTTDIAILSHELAHVHTFGTNFMSHSAEYRGIAFLYFEALAENGSDCFPSELMADAFSNAIRRGPQLYFTSCSNTPGTPSAATMAVIESVVALEIPDWFATTYGATGLPYDTSTDDRYDGMYDLEAAWADVVALPEAEDDRAMAVYAFRDAFGGYCHTGKAKRSAFSGGITRNPWQAGGCVPQAPEVTQVTGDTVSWQAPPYDGGSPTEKYVLEWRAVGQEFSSARSREITDLTVSRFQNAALVPGSEVRVTAHNHNGEGASTTLTILSYLRGVTVSPETLAVAQGASRTYSVVLDLEPTGTVTVAAAASGDPDVTVSPARLFFTTTTWNTPQTFTVTAAAAASVGDTATLAHTVSGADYEDNAVTARSVAVSVRAANRPPAFPVTETGARSVAENGSAGDTIGSPVRATDAESDTLTYTISDTTIPIEIVATTGQLRTTGPLNREGTPSYAFNVQVSDMKDVNGVADTAIDAVIAVTVTVTDVNEPPEISGDASIVREENDTSVLGTYTVTDPEDDDIEWDVEGADDDFFAISEGGELSFREAPNYELRKDRAYNVTVVAIDEAPDPNRSTFAVRVTVIDVDEPPTLEGRDSTNVAENGTTVTTYTATDPEDDDIEWDLDGTDKDLFSIIGGALAFKKAPDYEAPEDVGGTRNEYEVTIVASDAQGNESKLPVTVTVTNDNEPPVITAPDTPPSIVENSTNLGVGRYSARDPEDGEVPLSLGGDDEEHFTLSDSGALAFKSSPDFEAGSEYGVTLSASDGTHTPVLAVTVTVVDVDEPPDITAPDTPPSIVENSINLVVGSYSARDPERGVVTLSLGGVDASHFTLRDNGSLAFNSSPDFEAGSEYLVTIVARDPQDNESTLAVTVTVINVDEPPDIMGLATHSIAEHSTNLEVDRYSGDDPESDDVTLTLGGGDARHFTLSDSGLLAFGTAPDFEAPDDIGKNNAYEVTIKAEDEHEKTSTLDVTVTVTNEEEEGKLTLSATQPLTGTALTATLSDPDGGITGTTWTWESSTNQSMWSTISGASSGSYTPVTTDVGKYLRVTVSYTDGEDSGKSFQQVLPNAVQAPPPVNSAPEFPSSESGMRSVDENTLAGVDFGARVAATDPDSDNLTYSLDATGDGFFDIVATSGQLRTQTALDHETRSSYAVTVTATDPYGESDTIGVTISVTNLNEAPFFPDTLDRALSVRENTAAGADIGAPLTATDDDRDDLAYSLNSTDDALFDIEVDTGQLLTEAALDHEADDSYRVDVRVSDGKDADGDADTAIDATIRVTIRVTDVNEAPTFPDTLDTMLDVDENTAPGTDIGSRLTATDDDRDDLTYSLDSTDDALFDIEADTGQLLTDAPLDREMLDREMRDGYVVDVRVSDGKNANGQADTAIDATLEVTITVNGVNEPPVLTGTDSFRYDENGTEPLFSYTARDPEMGDITWGLSGTDEDYFAISDMGVLGFESPPDYEDPVRRGDNSYEVTVIASDADGNRAMLDVTVTVLPVNEAPELTGPPTASIDEHDTTFEAVYSAEDPDNPSLGWDLTGTDAGAFEISAAGVLTFDGEPDYESPRDSNRDNEYLVTVRVSDGTNPTTLDVVVTVNNVEEPGKITLSSRQPQAGTPLTASLADPDMGIANETWAWERSDRNSPTNYTTITGATGAQYTPADDDTDRFLRVTASYDDRQGMGKSAQETSANAVRAAPVTPNIPPEFPASETGRRSVDENTLAGMDIGEPVAASDADTNDTLTYSLDATGATLFDIDAGTGQLQTKLALDREQRSSYTVTVTVTDPALASDSVVVTITVEDVDEPPRLMGNPVPTVAENSTGAVARYTATDPERRPLTWTLSGLDRGAFDLVGGVLSFLAPPDYESPANVAGVNTYEVTVEVSDGVHPVSLAVTVTVTDEDESPRLRPVIIGIGGGGGAIGPPPGPMPSEADFEWTVDRDIEELDSGHDTPLGAWSDGVTLWIAQNGDGADDAVYAYDLASGERVEGREFELDERNRAPRGAWSDRQTVWVSDSGQDMLFAHDLASGEPVPDSDLALHPDNDDPRGIWSDGEVMWVLDDRDDALFGYDLASGELLAEYALHEDNDDPRGVWSDRVTVWVSDDRAKRLFAYRLPVPAEPAGDEASEEDREPEQLERVRDEEFEDLRGVSNNSPRGIWSDGEVMYVVDESDGKVYSYNMPDAIDVRLASLTLSGIDFGEFSQGQTEYEGVVADGVTETTVAAEALQSGATVVIKPADSDEATAGQQVALEGVSGITVTVTSADGSRTKVYRVVLAEAGPSASCLRGAISTGFSLLVYEGGSIADLEACAQSRQVTALYTLHEGGYVSYVLGAPDLVNQAFRELFPDGVPALSPLLVQSEGPPAADPAGGVEVSEPWTECLRGEVTTGFSLLVYEGGSVEELAACAGSLGVTALYALHEGAYVSYILGAPDLVNLSFAALFPDGVPAATPLVAKSD